MKERRRRKRIAPRMRRCGLRVMPSRKDEAGMAGDMRRAGSQQEKQEKEGSGDGGKQKGDRREKKEGRVSAPSLSRATGKRASRRGLGRPGISSAQGRRCSTAPLQTLQGDTSESIQPARIIVFSSLARSVPPPRAPINPSPSRPARHERTKQQPGRCRLHHWLEDEYGWVQW